jgi:hypothetical protein
VSNLEANLKAVSAERDDLRREVISNHTQQQPHSYCAVHVDCKRRFFIHVDTAVILSSHNVLMYDIKLLAYDLIMFRMYAVECQGHGVAGYKYSLGRRIATAFESLVTSSHERVR